MLDDEKWDERKHELIAALSGIALAQEIEFSLDVEKARDLIRAELARMRAGA